jgi:tetratricopeptide (TPR) repeat protein
VDTALAVAQDAVALARRTEHSLVITGALGLAARCSVLLRDPVGASCFAEEAMTSAKDHGFPHWEAHAKMVLGWVSARQAGARAGASEIREGIASRQSMGWEVALPFVFGLLCETELATGDPNAAVEAANEGLRWGEKNSEHIQDGFLLCCRGDAIMALGDRTQAEADYHRALAWSRERNARWIELNAGIRLARQWQADGRARDASELLAPVYGWFTEGFDNPVLRDAKALLEELTGKIGSDANSDRPADPSNS